MKRSFHSANQSVEEFEKEAKYRVVDSDEGRDVVNQSENNNDSNKSLGLESLMLVSPLPNRQRNDRTVNNHNQQQQSTRLESECEEACGTVLEASAEECVASPGASLDLTEPFTEAIALEATPLQQLTRLLQLMAHEERRKDERLHCASFAADCDATGSNSSNEANDDPQEPADCVASSQTASASRAATVPSTVPSPSCFKRRKCDWLALLQNIAPFNDKSGYERIKEIGDGTFSRVISARKKDTGELVAIKKLYMKSRDPISLALMREIVCLMRCQHENIVRFVELLITTSKYQQQKFSLVTELCEMDLYTMMKTRFPLERPFVKDIFHQMLLGLEYLHSLNIIHRDIKLSNYLITSDGVIKLCDFGLGKNVLVESHPHSPVVVTLSYRAPELLLSDRKYTSAVDMWAVGCCFAELLLGKQLFANSRFDIEQLTKIFSLFGVQADDPIFETSSSLTFVTMEGTDWKQEVFVARCQATESELALLESCFHYQKHARLTAAQGLAHRYWTDAPRRERYVYSAHKDSARPDQDSDGDSEAEEPEQWYGTDGRPLFGKRLDFNANQSVDGGELDMWGSNDTSTHTWSVSLDGCIS